MRLARYFGGSAALECARTAYNMWDGGNQWSGWVSYLSFFRHVARLSIDYSRWDRYETAALAGPRIMHSEFCIISERPVKLQVDSQSRPHCDDGPFCEWSDGTALYSWHGTRVPGWILEHPGRISAAKIDAETNTEVRRVMIHKYGADRYVQEGGAAEIHRDRFGVLYRREVPDDEPIVMVRVKNSTPEPDGTTKEYWLRVDPNLRPLLPGGRLGGEPQKLTAHNAVASTFGRRGEEYWPEAET